jgi:penicillin amidase
MMAVALLAGGVTSTAALGTLWLTRRSFPQYSGVVQLQGLDGSVEVIRDANGVPHIYADSAHDLFQAQGYIHAQDRFFQMEFWRRIGQGRLSELFGEATLNQDKFIRTLGWYRIAQEDNQRLPSDARAALDAYALGVNAYALNENLYLSLELDVLRLLNRRWSPEPWVPADTLVWSKIMSWNLGVNMYRELTRLMFIEGGKQQFLDDVFPGYPSSSPLIVEAPQHISDSDRHSQGATSSGGGANQAWVRELMMLSKSLSDWKGMPSDMSLGSNSWVLSGRYTTTGHPILANDPHLAMQIPSVWYAIGLHCRRVDAACPYDIVGMSFPGTPGVVVGHNQRIAWGITNSMVDTQDLYLERVSKTEPGSTVFRNGNTPVQTHSESIIVADRMSPVTITVRTTIHGPIINDILSDILPNAGTTQPIALAWASLKPSTIFAGLLKLNRAANWTQFREALQDWDTPPQSFVYADIDGNIGYQLAGATPVRAKGDGSVPVPGWTGDYEWLGFIPFDQLPSALNPTSGYVVAANNAIAAPGVAALTNNNDWDPGLRAQRIVDMIRHRDRFSVQDVQAMQMDDTSPFANALLDRLAQLQSQLSTPASNSPSLNALSNQAFHDMLTWDRRYTTTSKGALIFEAFWMALAHGIFDDDLGDELASLALDTGATSRLAVLNIMNKPESLLWDDVRTGMRELPADIVSNAFSRAVTFLSSTYGTDTERWAWGNAHRVEFKHQTLGQSGVRPIELIFNRGPFAVAGGPGLINATSNDTHNFIYSVPSMRQIIDLGDFSKSVFIHMTGQSGHPLHPHYDDFVMRWLAGGYIPMTWTETDIRRSAAEVLHLVQTE